jgi:hypothetical protein
MWTESTPDSQRRGSCWNTSVGKMAEHRLSIAQCRQLISDSASLHDEQVRQMRDTLYTLADVIVDAFIDLNQIDQGLFNPSGSITQQLDELEAQAFE